MLVFGLSLFARAQIAEGGIDTLDFRVSHSSGSSPLSESVLRENLPNTLRYVVSAGDTIRYNLFDVSIVPLSDSGGIHMDTVLDSPQYALVAYSLGYTVIVLLEKQGANYTKKWESNELYGSAFLGYVVLDDINQDGVPEIEANLVAGAHYSNVFLYSWNDGHPTPIGFSEKITAVSDFYGWVDLQRSDSGTFISVVAPDDSIQYVYLVPKGSQTVRQISQNRFVAPWRPRKEK
jgi:hypothetical protein